NAPIVEAENIMPEHRAAEVVRFPGFLTKVQVKNFHQSTAIAAPSTTRSFFNPYWNKDLSFVIDEPFINSLQVSVEDQMDGAMRLSWLQGNF
ncbi:hypothetical protein PIB30_096842, partial [Stylosanthes scabra]|nr:hypothetical protein [Stylosanthes scabra]